MHRQKVKANNSVRFKYPYKNSNLNDVNNFLKKSKIKVYGNRNVKVGINATWQFQIIDI